MTIQFNSFDELVEWLKIKRPETVYLVKNKQRYAEVMSAVRDICDLATTTDGVSILMPTNDETFGTTMFLELVGDPIVFDDMGRFTDALSKADTFEVRTKKHKIDGMSTTLVYVGITFQDVYNFATPR